MDEVIIAGIASVGFITGVFVGVIICAVVDAWYKD